VEITKDMDVILNFGGGCQGCSSVKVTLKNGVEAQLKSIYPEINNVLDVTDHSQKASGASSLGASPLALGAVIVSFLLEPSSFNATSESFK
jgi:hypothetical protein